MMKGLFNYQTAYREYTKLCLADFVRDNIQYAEIRPNFMQTNQLYTDDGEGMINNEGIMKIIISAVEEFQKEVAERGQFFGGLKVIYCTPRSMDRKNVQDALEECIEFKKRWPQWIAGKYLESSTLTPERIAHISFFLQALTLSAKRQRATRSRNLFLSC